MDKNSGLSIKFNGKYLGMVPMLNNLYEGRTNWRNTVRDCLWLQHIWLEVVKKEYEHSRVLEEYSLHSTVYFHLRKFSFQVKVLGFGSVDRKLASHLLAYGGN